MYIYVVHYYAAIVMNQIDNFKLAVAARGYV